MALLCLHGAFMVSQVGQSLTGRFVERYFHTLFGLPPSRGKDVGKQQLINEASNEKLSHPYFIISSKKVLLN